MKIHWIKFLFLIVSVLIVSGAGASEVMVRLFELRGCSIESLIADGYDIATVDHSGNYIDVVIDESYLSTLEDKAATIRVLPESWVRLLPSNTDDAGEYLDPEETWTFWTGLAAAHPDLVQSPVTQGQSFHGRDIYSICITSSAGPPDKPAIFFNSLIHAREPATNSVLADFGLWLATEYNNDTMATLILDNSEIYIIPIVNPDGYEDNMTGGNMQRKNMNFTTPVPSSGIDLNRNFGYMWGYDDFGSSPYPYDATYRGESAFSEPETEVIRTFTNTIDPIGSMHYHSYGGMLIYPWAHVNQATPHQSTFQSWASAMTAQNGYTFGRIGELFSANGDACDWSYENSEHQTCLTYGVEVDDAGFWGSQNDSAAIVEFSAECRFMNIMLCMNLINLTGIGISTEAVSPGILSVRGIFPNPVLGSLNLSADIPSGSLEVTILDLTGRRIDQFEVDNLESGHCQLSWTVPASAPNGVYLLMIESGNQTTGSRFTVLR
ncbi:MAG: M14 family zinc carboxypeptidase [Candidatus Fermentibacteria bacterium]